MACNDLEELLESFQDDPEREIHMKLLADAFFECLERPNCEYGGWGLDNKRPFQGNSLVEPDIAEIIGWDRDDMWEPGGNGDLDQNKCDYVNDLYNDLKLYLQYKWKQIK